MLVRSEAMRSTPTTLTRETAGIYDGNSAATTYTGTGIATIGANTDGVVCFALAEDSNSVATVSAFTLNSTGGTSLASIVEGSGSFSQYAAAYWWPSSSLPSSTGSYDVAVTWSEAMTGCLIYAVPFAYVRQVTPTVDTTTTTSTAISTSLSAVPAGSIVISACNTNNNEVGGITYDTDETSLDETLQSVPLQTLSLSYENVSSEQTVVHSRTVGTSRRQAMISVRLDRNNL